MPTLLTGAEPLNDIEVHPQDRAVLERAGLTTFDAVMALPQDAGFDKAGLKPWRRRTRIELQDAAGATHVYFLKRFVEPPSSAQFKRRLSGRSLGFGPAEGAAATALHDAGIRTFRVAATGQRITGGVEQASFVLIAQLAGESLERWWPMHCDELYVPEQSPRRIALIEELGAFCAQFHAAGFVHRDLYFSHVFLDESQPPGSRYALIDLGRVFRPRWRRARWIIKDLAELEHSASHSGVSRSDRTRFLMSYAEASGRPAGDKTLALSVLRKSQKIARHAARRSARTQRD